MDIRVARNAGSFYPNSKKEIENLIELFNSIYESSDAFKKQQNIVPKAVISPHAGYIYSGYTANIAHRLLAKRKVKRVVVIGPSHHIYFEGISGSFFKEYQTPIKNMPIDLEYLNILNKTFNLKFVPEAHKVEHSTETQMPFIAHYQPDVEVIELIYGKTNFEEVAKITTWLLQDSLTSVVISTDLSHFYPIDRANVLDAICLEGVAKRDIKILDIGCEACGIIGMKAIIKSANELNLQSAILDYRTSADVSKDESRVVGYMSAAFF